MREGCTPTGTLCLIEAGKALTYKFPNADEGGMHTKGSCQARTVRHKPTFQPVVREGSTPTGTLCLIEAGKVSTYKY